MTTNLFVIANVKQLRTKVVLKFYCLFSEHLGLLAYKIRQFLTVFTVRLSLARFWRAFGISGGLNTPNLPLGTPLDTITHSVTTFSMSVTKLIFTELKFSLKLGILDLSAVSLYVVAL